jgi:hypothetical protein
MAQHEYEAKFLNIDTNAVREQLRALGAQQAFAKTLFTRLIFENDAVRGEQWLRLRDEIGKTTLTLKQVSDATNINGTTEIEIEVDDLDKAAELLGALGLRQAGINRTTAKNGSSAASPTTSTLGPSCPPSSRSKARPKRPCATLSQNSASTTNWPATAASTSSTRVS